MAELDAEENLIATSDPEWLQKALGAYRRGARFRLHDDAGLGLNAEALGSGVALLRYLVLFAAVPWREVGIALTGIGLCSFGIWIIRLAIADPEPTSRLGILLAGGVILIVLGGASILRALGVTWRVSVKTSDGYVFSVEPA